MTFEVEQKFPIADRAALEARLVSLGARLGVAHEERDVYHTHPARDFGRTDEALRIRAREQESFLTYKGPKIDSTTKTRREIDLPLPVGDTPRWRELLLALGFQPLIEVRKQRQKATLTWEGSPIELSLDEVCGVGTFLELELIADEASLEPARARIASLAQALQLAQSERRSYLELLICSPGAQSPKR